MSLAHRLVSWRLIGGVFAATGVSLFFISLQINSARARENQLLQQICLDTPVGDSCKLAKNYPNGSACNIELDEKQDIEGRYIPPIQGASDGTVRILGYQSDCEAHVTEWGGSLLFEKYLGQYVFRGYEPGLVTEECINMQGRNNKQERLFCIRGGLHQGEADTGLFEVKLSRDYSGNVHVNYSDEDTFLTGMEDAGQYGAPTVDCKARMKILSLDKLRTGPIQNSVALTITYVDSSEIKKACEPGARQPQGVVAPAPNGAAFLPPERIKTDDFVLDLITRQLHPKTQSQRTARLPDDLPAANDKCVADRNRTATFFAPKARNRSHIRNRLFCLKGR
jgi:hypothetical protein